MGVTERSRERSSFPPASDRFLEPSLSAQNPSQITEGRHGGKNGLAKAFPPPITFKQTEDLADKLLRRSIIRREVVGPAEVEISRHLERKIAEGLGNGLGVLAEPDRLPRMTRIDADVTKIVGQLP